MMINENHTIRLSEEVATAAQIPGVFPESQAWDFLLDAARIQEGYEDIVDSLLEDREYDDEHAVDSLEANAAACEEVLGWLYGVVSRQIEESIETEVIPGFQRLLREAEQAS